MSAPAATGSKQKLALLVIGLSVLSLVLGFLMPKPLFDTFSLGAWIGFTSFMLSLGSVSDEGNNFFAMIAFWVSFIALCVTIFIGAMH